MQKIVSNQLLTILISILLLSSCTKKADKGWIQLFNGKDLSGWKIKIAGHPLGENYKNTFRVEDGLLKVRYDEYDKFNGEFAHIFYEKPYSSYKLRVEYRFVGEQVKNGPSWGFMNNGIMIHGQTPESMEINQAFPTSIEIQLLGNNSTTERTNLNVCTPGTNIVLNGQLALDHCIQSISKIYRGNDWVTAEVEVYADSLIRHIVDGEVVMEYTKPQLDARDPSYQKLLPPDGNILLKSGTISLQGESHPTDFRKIELLNLGDDCD